MSPPTTLPKHSSTAPASRKASQPRYLTIALQIALAKVPLPQRRRAIAPLVITKVPRISLRTHTMPKESLAA